MLPQICYDTQIEPGHNCRVKFHGLTKDVSVDPPYKGDTLVQYLKRNHSFGEWLRAMQNMRLGTDGRFYGERQ